MVFELSCGSAVPERARGRILMVIQGIASVRRDAVGQEAIVECLRIELVVVRIVLKVSSLRG